MTGKLLVFLSLLFYSAPLWAGPLPTKESLRYRISYSDWITLGFSEMSILGPCKEQPDCLHFSTLATSAPWLDSIFRVNDRIESRWDLKNRRSLWHHKDLQEGKLFKEYFVSFDYHKNLGQWEQVGYAKGTTGGASVGTTTDLPVELQDPLSAVFYARSHPLAGQVGMSFEFDVFDDLKLSRIKMDILAEEEVALEINGQKRVYMAHKIQPHYQTTGLFQRTSGKLYIWVMKDPPRLPLKFLAEVAVGSIRVELVEAEPLPDSGEGLE
ncbi:MAG: DUF3108 domain-containing protein [bacterium]|nr:DUF3108 domain-containing protein [bacterium]